MPAQRRGHAVILPSSPAYTFGNSRPSRSSGVENNPGAGDYDPGYQGHSRYAAAYTIGIKHVDCEELERKRTPGPGAYKAPCLHLTHPDGYPISMKFRTTYPEDKGRRPAPTDYTPTDALKLYKGEYTRIKIKTRHRPKMIESMPDPGPFEYGYRQHEYKPAYSMRLKLASQLDPPPYPGPGHYFEGSTIGNWGAGMAAHVPEAPDVSLLERMEVFARDIDPQLAKECREQADRMRLPPKRRFKGRAAPETQPAASS